MITPKLRVKMHIWTEPTKKDDEGGGDKSKTVEGGEERSHLTNKNVKIGCSPTKIWRFPKMGYPNHPSFSENFHYKSCPGATPRDALRKK
jgi:hypothetical protein